MRWAEGSSDITRERWTAAITGAVALALFAFGAWRSTLGVSYWDDAYLAAVPVRLAGGARIFGDEMWLQSFGFLGSVPFAKAWLALFGTSGVLLAMRLFYVALAGVTGFVVFRSLRPSFGVVPSALAAAAPLLAPPYDIIGLTYNTAVMLCFPAAVALLWAAYRDDDRRPAVAAGVALAFGSFSYPPLVVGAALVLASFAWLVRGRRLLAPALAASLGVLGAAALWLLATTPVGELGRAMTFVRAVHGNGGGWSEDSETIASGVAFVLSRPSLLPMWVLAAVSALPRVPRGVRSASAALLPPAAALLGVSVFDVGARQPSFGVVPMAFATLLTLALALPVAAYVRRERDGEVARLLLLAAPASLLSAALVTYSTHSGSWWSMPFVGLAPLFAVLVLGWMRLVSEGMREAGTAVASLALVGLLCGGLTLTVFRDGRPWQLDTRMDRGPFAGVRTTSERAERMEEVEAVCRRAASSGDRVLVVGTPAVYLFTDGRPHTNTVWLQPQPADRHTVRYFERRGSPDVVFVARNVIEPRIASGTVHRDPLLSFLLERYRLDARSSDVDVFLPQ